MNTEISVESEGISIDAQLVFVRDRRSGEWVCLLSTDMELTPEDIIANYGRRWSIEVFFKMCKSYLRLAKDCRSICYDAITAHVAIVFTRYTLLALMVRESSDEKSFGELFEMYCSTLPDILFVEALKILLDLIREFSAEGISADDKKLEELSCAFIKKLPQRFQNLLQKTA